MITRTNHLGDDGDIRQKRESGKVQPHGRVRLPPRTIRTRDTVDSWPSCAQGTAPLRNNPAKPESMLNVLQPSDSRVKKEKKKKKKNKKKQKKKQGPRFVHKVDR